MIGKLLVTNISALTKWINLNFGMQLYIDVANFDWCQLLVLLNFVITLFGMIENIFVTKPLLSKNGLI